MNPRDTLVTAVIAAVFLPLAQAQTALASGQSPAAAAAPASLKDLVVPIHSLPADPVFGAYGVWAGGAGYKVRFDAGVTFFPRLGPTAPRNLPLRWRTLAVRVGDHVLVDAATDAVAGPASRLRYEYRRGPVVEAYDVRADGLEQTFVLAARPGVAGDLVVEGSLETELRSAASVAGAHGDLDFADPRSGRAAVRYGRAFVLDATGRKQPIGTSWDGSVVRLRVPGAFLASAVFPVTVDPLTSPIQVDLDAYLQADLASAPTVSNQQHVLVHSLYTSATDIDMIVFSHGQNWTTSAQLFADLSDGWHSAHPAVAYCGVASRWVVAFERQNTASQIRLYLHDRDDTVFNSGQLVFMSRMATNSHDWKADVGGLSTGVHALVVCQSEFGTSFDPNGVSDVFGRVVDVSTGAMASAPFALAGSVSSSLDREGPSVSTTTRGTASSGNNWQTAWSQRTVPSGVFAVYTASVNRDATVQPALRIDDPAQPFHKVGVKVDGGFAEQLVTYTLASSVGQDFGPRVHGTRFRTVNGQVFDVRHRSIVTAPVNQTVANSGLAFDWQTDSHWAVAFHTASTGGVPNAAHVARVGFEAGVTELQTLTGPGELGARPVVAYSLAPYGFAVANAQFRAIMVRHFFYPPEAGTTVVGPGCGGATISTTSPYAGNGKFYVSLGAAPIGATAVPMLAFAQAAVPLDFLGMTGCVLHLAPASLLTLPPRTNSLLGSTVHLPLPEPFVGDFYAQWMYSDPLAPGGARVSPGLRIRVR